MSRLTQCQNICPLCYLYHVIELVTLLFERRCSDFPALIY